jgi:predicted transposase YdaD
MALSDWTSGVNFAREEGRREGERQGRREIKRGIARSMKADLEPLDKIMRYTGLLADEIASL